METRTEQIERALKLYKSYKTESREYFEIANSLGMNTAGLNQRCWKINYDKRS